MSKIGRVSRSRLGGPFVVAPTLTPYISIFPHFSIPSPGLTRLRDHLGDLLAEAHGVRGYSSGSNLTS